MSETTHEDEWRYDAYRIGRVTRTVEVPTPDGDMDTIEEGTLRFDPINEEDEWMWTEDDWIDRVFSQDDLSDIHVIPHEKVGILEFPRPMTDAEASEWLQEDDERWRQFLDDELESDTTAADLLDGEIR